MKQRPALFRVLQALSCLAFALALVLSPPSSAHAHEAMHGVSAQGVSAHETVAGADMQADDGHAHDHAQAQHCAASSDAAETSAGAGQCCNGICLSVVLADTVRLPVSTETFAHQQISTVRLIAFDPVGVLRPPKHLI
ncbi:hypothetical protein P775_15575 [Puniceibacterium antarcticum]|uniref:CopL family metal-binding regulatory protein n=2 Tax=Puniceibacterium antarcticum TaxID=1206336 RepID=A0A2G8RCA5_9RHOB|nr:hypothetical protein P775_15575 [Puniceibacterium antarcticum]